MIDDVERVLVIAAHPDDIDFSAGGTVATWTDAGVEVAYGIVTDGDAGGFDPEVPRNQIAGIRRAEQQAAGKVLGVSDIDFLGYQDGQLTVTLDLRRDLARLIRRRCPDLVVLPSPLRDLRNMFGSHPDHTATGEAAMCAVYPDARNPFAFPELAAEGFAAHTVREVWISTPNDRAEHRVDISDTFDRKVAALRAHVSQTAHLTGLDDRMRQWAEGQARGAGWAEGRMAEGFVVLDTA